MKRCPKCKKLSVTFDPYKGAEVCMMDDCSCIVIDDKSFSYLKTDFATNTIRRIKVVSGSEMETIKKYKMI